MEIKHECGNHIQHEGEARGLYAATTRGHYSYSTDWGALTGLYPTVVTSTSACGMGVWFDHWGRYM